MKFSKKTFIVIAGPNGAGKTTFVEGAFPKIVSEKKFVNADHFARDINPDDVSKVAIQAGKEFLKVVDHLILGNETFIIETTLSGMSLLKKIKIAQENGFQVKLIFLSLSSASLCDFRVKARVASGGHNITLIDIKRRFRRGLLNLNDYRAEVDSFELYNSDNAPSLILSEEKQVGQIIHNHSLFDQFKSTIKKIQEENQLV